MKMAAVETARMPVIKISGAKRDDFCGEIIITLLYRGGMLDKQVSAG
jgi:hypothetical protein